MEDIEKLREMIDERNYPYFEDAELIGKLKNIDDNFTINDLAKELCLEKAGIQEMRLGDVTIPSPRDYFLNLASKYRKSYTGVVKRADEY